ILSLAALGAAVAEGAACHALRARLYADPDSLKAAYTASPDWLKRLMDAWAAGLNYYLHTHPDVQPRVIRRFEPWMALSFTEGSIGGDIERISLSDLREFYGSASAVEPTPSPLEETLGSLDGPAPEPRGSNGFA